MNYGGGTGSNSNGANFKELLSEYPDIIIVNVTMRVSYFSTINLKLFEGYDDANEGGKYDKSNDVGRTDLIASLKWINANIAAFGGDPANVSLYGASGGAVTACTPLILEDTGKYFKRVILSSGVALDTISVGSLEENNVQTREFIKYFNEVRDPKIEVKTVEDALALTPEQILEAQKHLSSQCIGAYFPGSKSKTFSNIIDGIVIKEDYLQTMIDNIKNYDIEVMAITSDGEYDNDLSKARLGLPADATDEEYAEAALNAIVTANWSKLDPDQGGAENASELIQGYVTRGEEIGRGTILSYQDLKNDINQKCSAVMLCELVEALGGKAYLASYNYNTNDSARGAHAASVRPVIGVLSQQVPKAMEMGKAWRAAVVGFVTNGNPNANTYFQKAGINWPTFKAETHEELVLDTEFGVEKISDVRWEDINSLLPLFREYAHVEELLDEALEDQLAVKATTGTYIGAENEKGIQSFRSIKYATTKRWEESVPVGPSDEVFDASGSISVVPYQSAGATKTEDYVTLDIYRSSKNTNSKSPVIMQVNYGGGTGSNSNGADFSGILTDYPELVIVNVTMRVSYFSTINLSLFDGYKEANVGGKYDKSNDAGRTDLIAALKWINSNIAAFGGDPENVTITGGSGGAVTACTPLILEGTGQYFKRVVLSSGVALDDISVGSQEENDVATREFMKATGAKTVEEALALTPEDILKAQSAFTSQCIGAYFPGSRSKTFSNIIDGIVIKENYLETMMDNIVNYGI